MNKHDLFDEVRRWLEAEKHVFCVDNKCAEFRLIRLLEHGLVPIRLICEESPALLQACCILPVIVPKEKLCSLSLMLHHINVQLRVGSFQLIEDDSLIMYRLAHHIHADSDLASQFNRALGRALNSMENHFQALALYLCSTPQARKLLAKLEPTAQSAASKPAESGPRFELN